MRIEEAIVFVLASSNHGMKTDDIAKAADDLNCVKDMFMVEAAIEVCRLGYKYE